MRLTMLVSATNKACHSGGFLTCLPKGVTEWGMMP